MPRETVHWMVLQQAASSAELEAFPSIRAVLQQNAAIAALGALAHDAPYYYRFGGSDFEQIGNILHGADREDTFDPIRALSSAVVQAPPEHRPILWAFVIGMMSHMATDIVFHPAVFYFTGNYHDHLPGERRLAQARHRLFEVYLDSWARRHGGAEFPARIRTYRQQASVHYSLLPDLLGSALPFADYGQSGSKELWRNSLQALIIFQSLFVTDFVGLIFRKLVKIFPHKLLGIDALFAYGRRENEAFFEGKLEFLNPISGEKHSQTVHELITEAVKMMLGWLKDFEVLVSGAENDVQAAIGHLRGQSLNFGTFQVSADQMRFASTVGADLPGLVISH